MKRAKKPDTSEIQEQLPEMVTLQQAGQEMNVPPTSIRDWCRRGHLKFVQVEGSRRILICRGDLVHLIKRSTFGRGPEAVA